MSDKYYTIIRFNTGKVVIWKTYGDHTWGSPIYEVMNYANTYKEAKLIARRLRHA